MPLTIMKMTFHVEIKTNFFIYTVMYLFYIRNLRFRGNSWLFAVRRRRTQKAPHSDVLSILSAQPVCTQDITNNKNVQWALFGHQLVTCICPKTLTA